MAEQYGASPEAWEHWGERLGLTEHLLPVVANPNARISAQSNMKALGKTPSQYNFRGEVSGFAKWTEHRSTFRQVERWAANPDYGICVQTRSIRAFDIDVEDEAKAAAIRREIEAVLPLHFFNARGREGTGKVLLPFMLEAPLTKRVLPVEGGLIEILGDGQQFIAESSYLKGGEVTGRYVWDGGWPTDFPLLTLTELEDVCEALAMLFDVGVVNPRTGTTEYGWKIAHQRREGGAVDLRPRATSDPVEQFILQEWEVRGDGAEGEVYIRCPFADGHSMDSGPSETAYFPAGTGGFVKGHFKCLHASCMTRDDDQFLQAIGFAHAMDDAPVLPDEPEEEAETGAEVEKPPVLRFMLDNKGRKENRTYNIELFLSEPRMCGMRLAHDQFNDQIVWCRGDDEPGAERWRLFSDEHYVNLTSQMDRHGFVPVAPSTVRPVVWKVASKNRIDIAKAWADRLPAWDGVPRIEDFFETYFKALGNAFSRAAGLYAWTAQAGRLLDPGCQVDMVPILVGAQGVRKTSAVAAIAPHRDMYTEINLLDRDGDTIRKMRGKLVIELEELRGLARRDVEDTKSFITRREEEWVPKYKEFTSTFKRRFVFYGTTNEDNFLGDPTGERRYLPLRVGLTGGIEVEAIERDRDQLWAEAIALWREQGVLWQEAERLAKFEHYKFKNEDMWQPLVTGWLLTVGALSDPDLAPCDMPYEWGIAEVLSGAVNIPAARATEAERMRMGRVLKSLGVSKKRTRGGWKNAISREIAENAARDDDAE